MAQIQFKQKIKQFGSIGSTYYYEGLKIPNIERIHCDMPAFRSHERFGVFANSDLFESMIRQSLKGLFPTGYIKLNEPLPSSVKIDTSKFLAVVTIEL